MDIVIEIIRNHCFGVKTVVMPPSLLIYSFTDGLRSYTALHNARKFPHGRKNEQKKHSASYF